MKKEPLKSTKMFDIEVSSYYASPLNLQEWQGYYQFVQLLMKMNNLGQFRVSLVTIDKPIFTKNNKDSSQIK